MAELAKVNGQTVVLDLDDLHAHAAILAYALSTRDDAPEKSDEMLSLLVEIGAIKLEA